MRRCRVVVAFTIAAQGSVVTPPQQHTQLATRTSATVPTAGNTPLTRRPLQATVRIHRSSSQSIGQVGHLDTRLSLTSRDRRSLSMSSQGRPDSTMVSRQVVPTRDSMSMSSIPICLTAITTNSWGTSTLLMDSTGFTPAVPLFTAISLDGFQMGLSNGTSTV